MLNKLSASCDESQMSSLFNPNSRQLSSSINYPLNHSGGGTSSNGNSPPLDPNNNLLSKSWCVNGSNAYDHRGSGWQSMHCNVNQSMDNLSTQSQLYLSQERSSKNGLQAGGQQQQANSHTSGLMMEPSHDMSTTFRSMAKSRPDRHGEWSTLNAKPMDRMTNFRGFISHDETTLRRQIHAANHNSVDRSGGGFLDNPSNQSVMFGSAINYPFAPTSTTTTNSSSASHNGLLSQTMPISGDCTNGSVSSIVDTSACNRFIATSSSDEAMNDSAAHHQHANTNGNGNDFERFIQELCQAQKE